VTDPTYYQRNLPHWLPHDEYLFVTFRLAGSLPPSVVARLQQQWQQAVDEPDPKASFAQRKQYFGRFDQVLDTASSGPLWLRQPAIAEIANQALHYFDGRAYRLICYCIMPNHVHLLVYLPPSAPPMATTLQRLKSFSALHANRLLNRTGQFWQRESYDHLVRSAQEMQNVVAYIVENPVKSGLIDDWQQWPYTYWPVNEPPAS
jgi:putative transposase